MRGNRDHVLSPAGPTQTGGNAWPEASDRRRHAGHLGSGWVFRGSPRRWRGTTASPLERQSLGCQSNRPRLVGVCRSRRPAPPDSSRQLGSARSPLRSCRAVHASRQGRRDAASACSASRLGGHGHCEPHQTHLPSWLGCACRPSMCCASRHSRRSTTSVGSAWSIWSTLTIRYPSRELRIVNRRPADRNRTGCATSGNCHERVEIHRDRGHIMGVWRRRRCCAGSARRLSATIR